MSEMIQRVEAALAEVIADSGNQKLASALGLYLAEHKGELGRTAIKAMREPTEAMINNDDLPYSPGEILGYWHMMIDEALK